MLVSIERALSCVPIDHSDMMVAAWSFGSGFIVCAIMVYVVVRRKDRE